MNHPCEFFDRFDKVIYFIQEISKPGPDLEFSNEIVSIDREAKKLKKEGVNIIIALGHSGIYIDKEIAMHVPEVKDLLTYRFMWLKGMCAAKNNHNSFSKVDVVVGGHTNTFLYTGDAPSNEEPVGPYPILVEQNSGKKVPVVQAYAYTKYLGHLKLTFDNNGDLIQFEVWNAKEDSQIAGKFYYHTF